MATGPDTLDSKIDPKPLAAFRLGFCAHDPRGYALDEMITVLVEDIHPNVYMGLQRHLEELAEDREHGFLPMNFRSAVYDPDEWKRKTRRPWHLSQQRMLCDTAISASSPYHEFYNLGAALGDYSNATLTQNVDREEAISCARAAITRLTKQYAERVIALQIVLKSNSPNANLEQLFLKALAKVEVPESPLASVTDRFVAAVEQDLKKWALPPSVSKDKLTDARDRWIYEECRKGTPYKQIILALKEKVVDSKAKGGDTWETITSDNGIKAAASRYATRNKLEPPLSRQSGRRPAES
jgi:hypothetical protein